MSAVYLRALFPSKKLEPKYITKNKTPRNIFINNVNNLKTNLLQIGLLSKCKLDNVVIGSFIFPLETTIQANL